MIAALLDVADNAPEVGALVADAAHVLALRGVQSPRFRVQGSGFRVQCSGFRVQGTGYRVQGPRSASMRVVYTKTCMAFSLRQAYDYQTNTIRALRGTQRTPITQTVNLNRSRAN